MSRLIHLNGAPGVGKSSLASRYLDDHPFALLVDIDTIRSTLGQWRDHEESKVVAPKRIISECRPPTLVASSLPRILPRNVP